MTLWVPPAHIACSIGSHATTRPATAWGAVVTPGTSGYGSWVSLVGSTGAKTHWLHVNLSSNTTSAASKNVVVKLGIDPAGGTSYSDLTPGLIGGSASSAVSQGLGGISYAFPLCIPKGAAIAAAAYGSVADTIRCAIRLTAGASGPLQSGKLIEAVGLAGGYVGTSVTQGTTSDGAWTSLGTTTRDLWAWEVGMQIATSDANWVGSSCHVDLAWGGASNKHLILEDVVMSMQATENTTKQALPAFAFVPAGATIYARAQNTGSTLDPLVVAAYGVGG